MKKYIYFIIALVLPVMTMAAKTKMVTVQVSLDGSAIPACAFADDSTRTIVLGHLSRENNTPGTAFRAVRTALDSAGFGGVSLFVAPPDGDMEMEVPPCCVSG